MPDLGGRERAVGMQVSRADDGGQARGRSLSGRVHVLREHLPTMQHASDMLVLGCGLNDAVR